MISLLAKSENCGKKIWVEIRGQSFQLSPREGGDSFDTPSPPPLIPLAKGNFYTPLIKMIKIPLPQARNWIYLPPPLPHGKLLAQRAKFFYHSLKIYMHFSSPLSKLYEIFSPPTFPLPDLDDNHR